ncbi:hypothetical protein [Treponema sp. R6D11]
MRKTINYIFILLLSICLFATGFIPAKADVYSGLVTFKIVAPEDFKDEIMISFTSVNFESQPVEGDTRLTAGSVIMNPQKGYVQSLDNMMGGKHVVSIKFTNINSEDNWKLEKFAYDKEVVAGENVWEFNVTKVPDAEKPYQNSKPFWQIFTDLLLSTWQTSGPVIITLAIVCLWYLKYKYDHFDKF